MRCIHGCIEKNKFVRQISTIRIIETFIDKTQHMKGVLFGFSLFVFAAFLFFAFHLPIQNTDPLECAQLEARIVSISEGPSDDIVFQLEQGSSVYINRGLEQGLNIHELKSALAGKTARIWLAKQPTIFGHWDTTPHIAQLVYGKEVFYSEFD
jgi:hypothetical protein